ncbi:MAG: hypothetical protein ACTMUB_03895 [cyanobacterium endosymbiont of Rhopalodia musculus]|nr:hypothetical protein [cyanobacterium endosymbiont of Epithemia clementina EcSB]WGT67334.1 hypothetical protein P3F56_09040 [cyanobacterium endosymbiont of Epithemia clementina EcSB]
MRIDAVGHGGAPQVCNTATPLNSSRVFVAFIQKPIHLSPKTIP